MSNFKKATKKQAKLRLALFGVSGSGKTYSALRFEGKEALKSTDMLIEENKRLRQLIRVIRESRVK